MATICPGLEYLFSWFSSCFSFEVSSGSELRVSPDSTFCEGSNATNFRNTNRSRRPSNPRHSPQSRTTEWFSKLVEGRGSDHAAASPPGRSRYRTSAVLELHMSDNRFYRAASVSGYL